MFVILKFVFFFVFGKLGPSREPSGRATRTRREFLFRNSYPRYASVGVPASNTPGDRLTSLRNRLRKIADDTVCATACSFSFVFFFSVFRYELIQLDGHNGLMRKSGC